MKTIVSPDGTVQISGEPEFTKDGVLIANTLFQMPPFQIIDGAPPSRWATWENGKWIDHPAPIESRSRSAILADLAAIDHRKVRALTDAALAGDKTRLAKLEAVAADLRDELKATAP